MDMLDEGKVAIERVLQSWCQRLFSIDAVRGKAMQEFLVPASGY